MRDFTLSKVVLLTVSGLSLTACQSLGNLIGGGVWERWDQAAGDLGHVPLLRIDTYALSEDSDIVGEPHVVRARQQDTLLDIARRYDLGYSEITAANPGVDPWLPREGTPVVLPTQFILPDAPRKGIVLNLAAMRLFYFPKPKKGETPVVITHPIGIGRENWRTPRGLTRVVKKVTNPSWYVPASIRAEHAAAGDPLPAVVPPGPDNPLGRYALRLAIPGYLIHGTNKPAGIGMRVSHGCIQLYPEDIETLFERVSIGTEVRIVNQPYLAGWHQGVLYLEAHRPLEEESRAWGKSLKPVVRVVEKAANKGAKDEALVDWERVKYLARLGRGFPVAISAGTPNLDEMLAALPVHATPWVREPGAADKEELSLTQWYIQAGSFKTVKDAKRLAAMVRHLGSSMPARYVNLEGYYRVLAGPFPTRSEAEAGAKRIKSSLGTETVVVDSRDLR